MGTHFKDSKDSFEKVAGKITQGESRKEGQLTRTVEEQAAKLPSLTWLGLAAGTFTIGALLQFFSHEKKELGNFIGLCAPCFLLVGIYNKLVKLEGSDRFSDSSSTLQGQQGRGQRQEREQTDTGAQQHTSQHHN